MATYAVYPSSLPQIYFRDAYSERKRSPKYSFEPEVGDPIERPKGTIKQTEIQCSIPMTRDQVETFEEFVENDLNQGVTSFYFTHPRKGIQVKAKLAGGNNPFELNEITFDSWQVSFVALITE